MKILYFYPENPLNKNQGNNARALQLLYYFKNKNIEVDFVGVESREFKNSQIINLKKIGLVAQGYLLPQYKRSKNKIDYFLNYSLPDKLGKRISNLDRTRDCHINAFNDILNNNEYEFIIISYAYWSSLIENNPNVKNSKLIVDTHDFLTSQFQNSKRFNIGNYFEKEISSLNLFNSVFVVSVEEQYIFSQFLENRVELISHFLEDKSNTLKSSLYDIIYVASDNEHNLKSARWFFDKVYNFLNPELKILVVGKIGKHIKKYKNVEKIEFVENLDEYYSVSKIAICPMLSGTGVKIKVIEALSFGIPVVCNERGIDGLSNKTNNGCLVTNNPMEFANFIQKLHQDSVFYEIHSENAKQFFKENHYISNTYSKLDKVFGL